MKVWSPASAGLLSAIAIAVLATASPGDAQIALHRAGVPTKDYEKFADSTGPIVEV